MELKLSLDKVLQRLYRDFCYVGNNANVIRIHWINCHRHIAFPFTFSTPQAVLSVDIIFSIFMLDNETCSNYPYE